MQVRDRHIYHICRIANHPVNKLPKHIQINYLSGLGSALFSISKGHPYMRLLFREWSISVCGSALEPAFQGNKTAETQALSLKRVGFKFFRLKYEYFFDCFYLTYVFDSRLRGKLYAYLKEHVAGIFNKQSLNKVNDYFEQGKECAKIPKELIDHLLVNRTFEQQPLKRVLVVANVSAGKSTLINALVGYRLNKSKTTACTNRLSYLLNKPAADGISIFAGNENFDYYEQIETIDSERFLSAGLHFDSALSKYKVCLIDTPGVNNCFEINHREITEKTIKYGNYDMLLYVSNCQYFGTTDEKALLQTIIKHSKKPAVFILSQLDRFKSKEDSVAKMLQDYHDNLVEFGVQNPVVIPVSAYTALLMKLERKNELDEDELDELSYLREKFSRPFFDLPSYIENGGRTAEPTTYSTTEQELIDRTGITLLEETIIKTIKL